MPRPSLPRRTSTTITTIPHRAVTVLAIAALVVVAAACSSHRSSDAVTSGTGSATVATAGGSNATTTTTSTTGAPASTTTPAAGSPTPLWQRPPQEQHASAEDAATTFAATYLGMANPTVASAPGDGPVGPPLSTIPGATVVRVAPGGAGPATALSVVKTGDGWQVVRADAAGIRLEAATATAGPGGSTTITLKGTSQTFEGTVAVQARPLAWVPGKTQPLAQTTEIGGSSGGPGPFSATLTIPAGTASPVVVLLGEPDASGRGGLTQATAVAVALS